MSACSPSRGIGGHFAQHSPSCSRLLLHNEFRAITYSFDRGLGVAASSMGSLRVLGLWRLRCGRMAFLLCCRLGTALVRVADWRAFCRALARLDLCCADRLA